MSHKYRRRTTTVPPTPLDIRGYTKSYILGARDRFFTGAVRVYGCASLDANFFAICVVKYICADDGSPEHGSARFDLAEYLRHSHVALAMSVRWQYWVP